jgi:energy-coupling factor transport system substrate-specific component
MTWVIASFLLLGVALTAGFAWYERAHPTARVIALVATLAALAALGRIAFAPLPNVKPTTDIVLISGYVLGGAPGFAVGAVAALASNLFFGQGPWTPWQMAGWAGVGLAGAGLARVAGRELGRIPLAAACGVASLGFGLVMNLHLWISYSGDHSAAKLAATFATSLPFDLAHAIGSVLFCLAFGPALVRALSRYRRRFEVHWVPLPATAVLLALVALSVAAPVARAQTGPSVRYLIEAQNDDGGWGAAPDQASSQLYSGWTALGLAAAGRNPRDVGSPSAVAYIRDHASELNDLGEINRTILVLAAAGLQPRLGDRDLEAEVAGKQRPNGSFARRVNTTAFAVLGLRAAGRGPRSRAVRRAADWIAGEANRDGGFNFGGQGGPSGIDDTSAAIQALVAAGRRRSGIVKRAVRFIVRNQASDGGFALIPGGASNAQSTAWAIQGLLAGGRNPARVRRNSRRDPMSYLRSLTADDGSVRYSRSSRQTPVWVTGQAIAALSRKTLPLAPVPRDRRATTASGPDDAAGGGGPSDGGAARGGGTSDGGAARGGDRSPGGGDARAVSAAEAPTPQPLPPVATAAPTLPAAVVAAAAVPAAGIVAGALATSGALV